MSLIAGIIKDKKESDFYEELQEILEASFDGILVTDGDGVGLFVNPSYTRNTGIKPEEILQHNVKELLNPIWMKKSIALEVIEKKESVSMEHDTKNGNHILVTGTPIFNEDGSIKRVVVNTRDLSDINHLKMKLNEAQAMEKIYLKSMGINRELLDINDESIVINNRMRDIYEVAKRVSTYNTTVLITGESGTGKELIAQYIHKQDISRKDKPFVVINCGAIPENLLESELFGYVGGSFTGAVRGGRKGIFEQADGGIIFLDEIGEMSLALQVKLLRVLENHTIMKIGQSEETPVNVRIIAATNRDLEKEVRDGRFRDDLFYRLNVVTLKVPPLRERLEEIVPLATKFINKFNAMYGQHKKLTYKLVQALEAYEWPGNVRELKNVMENMVVISQSDYLSSNDLPWIKKDENRENEAITLKEAVAEFEKQYLRSAKEQWKTTEKMAKVLGVNQSTISRKLCKYNI